MIKKVILVFKTHFDIGFTDLAEKVLDWYAGPMLDDVLKTCQDTADMGTQKFIWTMSAMPLAEMLERNTGEKYEQLRALVEEKRIVWHGLPFTSHTDFCGVEEMIRGFAYSERLCREFDRPRPVTAKMSDVPGHGRILPTILARAGVRFLHLGSNEFAMSPELPPLFFWEGPDGSRVLTMYSTNGYGAEQPPENWPFPVWISFQHTHDNMGPQTADSLREIVKKVQTEMPHAEVISGSMEEFYEEISRCDLSSIPVIREDLADSWIHGVGSYPSEASSVRTARCQVMELEAVLTLLEAVQDGDEQTIAGIYESLNRFGEHTWGLDVKTWLPAEQRVYEKQAFLRAQKTETYRYMEESWNEQRQHAQRTRQHLGQLTEHLRNRFNKADLKNQVVVLNANGSSFTGWVRGLQDSDAGMELFGERYLFAEAVPALSLSVLPPAAENTPQTLTVRQEQGMLVAENHRYRITVLADNGQVREVYDRSLGCPLLAAKGETGVFDYHYDKYGSDCVAEYLNDYCQIPSDWGIQDNGREAYPVCERETFTPAFCGWEVKGRSLELSYRGQASGQYGDSEEIKLVLTLPERGEELFAELILAGKQESPYIESGSLLFPFAGDAPGFRFNKNGQLLNPATDIAKGANHALYCLEAFAAMEEQSAGVCIVAHDTPLTAIGETGIYEFRQDYEEHQPVLYFNLFNNMWGTNFPQWTGGDFRFRYTIFGYRSDEALMERGLRLYQGASAVSLPAVESPFVLPSQVQVLAFIPDSSGGILRLRDTSGQMREMEITCRDLAGGLQELDLNGQPMGNLCTGRLLLKTGCYDIRTMKYYKPEYTGGHL